MDLILVLRSLFLYFGSYTCITEHILVLRILYLYYGAYTCLTDFILVLWSLFLSYGSYTCITDLMPVRDLFLCEGAYRFILVPKDTYLYLYQIHILIQEYLYTYLSLLQTYTYQISRRSYRASMCTEVPLGTTEIRLILQSLYLYYRVYTCSEVPVGTTQIHYTEVPVGTTGLKFTFVRRYP